MKRTSLPLQRREFITLLGGAAAAWPLGARAQQSVQMRRIGVLMSYLESDAEAQEQTKAFSQSLKEFGWTDGVNIRLDYRWPGSDADRLQADALELLCSAPDVLLAGATPAVIALKKETRSIPIVFANVADPVGQRFVATLAQPVRQHKWIWRLRIFDSREMGGGNQRDCSFCDVAPSFYRATIGVWSSVMPCWAVVAAVRGAKPSVERSAADRRAAA